jgi:hypothetical protein
VSTVRITAAHGCRVARLLLLLLLPHALILARANAQVDPLWDHYKVYNSQQSPAGGTMMWLRDQFGFQGFRSNRMLACANAVEKAVVGGAVSPIHDPTTHYMLWDIGWQPFAAIVAITNQFGDQTLAVREGRYLLNPAREDESGTPPIRNHYKCYACSGQPVNREVVLTDQWGVWTATVTYPRLFCNPAEKTVGTQTYPILDPNQCYVAYEYQPEDPRWYFTAYLDQFARSRYYDLRPSNRLLVPTLVTGVTATSQDTWGRLKSMYR